MLPLALLAGLVPFDADVLLDAMLRKGVTPNANACAALVKLWGDAPEVPDELFRRLGVGRPKRAAFAGFAVFLRDDPIHAADDGRAALERRARAEASPWKPDELPDVAAWLRHNEAALGRAAEAAKLPAYYLPRVRVPDRRGVMPLAASPNPYIGAASDLAEAFRCRAMMREAQGKPGEAWGDALAALRLARHLTRGGTLIEAMLGRAMHDKGCATARRLSIDLSADEARRRLKEFDSLPPFSKPADLIDGPERLLALDAVRTARRNSFAPTAASWLQAEADVHRWFDRFAATARVPGYAAKSEALARLEKDRRAARSALPIFAAPPLVTSEKIISLNFPAVSKSIEHRERAEQHLQNTRLALALAAFKADGKKYPAALAELAPEYLAEIPSDLFSGRPLLYRAGEGGYAFWSVGPNGKDDGGRGPADHSPGDDVAARVPSK